MEELHAELKSALRAIEDAEGTFKTAVEAVQTAVRFSERGETGGRLKSL